MVVRFKINAGGITGYDGESSYCSLFCAVSNGIDSFLAGFSRSAKSDAIQIQQINIALKIERIRGLTPQNSKQPLRAESVIPVNLQNLGCCCCVVCCSVFTHRSSQFLLVVCVSHRFDHAKPVNLISAGLLKLHRDVLNGCARLILVVYENNLLFGDINPAKG